ncbi:MAG TPA: lipoprotein-releasing ABC transporter permease subunit [Gammaproteobacteria bacterium]
MFQPLELFVGLRYVRSRRRRGIVSFMSGASLIGVALGVAALIVILSVMNGLESELRTRLLAMTAHATLSSPEGGLDTWQALADTLATRDGVESIAPFVTLEGMLRSGPNLVPAVVRGVLPERERMIADSVAIVDGAGLDALEPGRRRLILGRTLAALLGAGAGDTVDVLVPRVEHGRLTPKLFAFTVAGVFDAGVPDHNQGLALANVEDASVIGGLDGRVEGLAVRLADALDVDLFRASIGDVLEKTSLRYSDWTEEHASYFTAIRIEKTMMTIILMFIVGVAAFNIVASLMMVVTEKKKDIAILRTSGLEPGRVAKIFFVQGSVIGLAGTILGTVIGLALALNVDVIVPWLEQTFHFRIFPGDVYYVTEVPSEVHAVDVTLIPVIAFALTVLATLYPSRRAAAIGPAEALRYE